MAAGHARTRILGGGGAQVRTNRAFVELATGMHYRSGNQWKESKELIESFPGGAIARCGPHKVIFANNLNTAGAVDVETPDGQRLRSTPLGLSYRDIKSGKTVWLAEIQDCQGRIIGSNQVIYAGAFGKLADLRYTYRKSGWEQDVILRASPDQPESYGLDPESTVLEVATEFISPPKPNVSSREKSAAKEADEPDQEVSFGGVKLGRGRAFSLPEERGRRHVPVKKQWLNVDNRSILMENVPLRVLKADLARLPKLASTKQQENTALRLAGTLPLSPTAPARGSDASPMEIAGLSQPQQGVVLDYVAYVEMSGGYYYGDWTFFSDTTYFIEDYCGFSGTVQFEAGTILKFWKDASSWLELDGPVVWKTESYRPALFTSADDDTIGEFAGFLCPNWTGEPTVNPGQTYVYFYNPTNISVIRNARFCYAGTAAFAYNEAHFWNCQFIQCRNCVGTGGGWSNYYPGYGELITPALYFRNCLMEGAGAESGRGNAVAVGLSEWDWDFDGLFLVADHVTAVNFDNDLSCPFWDGEFANSLLVNVQTITAAAPVQSHNAVLASAAGIFEVGGSGNYYLPKYSPYRNGGSAGSGFDGWISESLANLKGKTTEAPIAIPRFMVVSGELTFFPQTRRYTSGSTDLGYHYDALDYTIAAMLVDGGSITVQPGTAIGFRQDSAESEWWQGMWPWWWTEMGIELMKDSTLISRGTPTMPNIFTDVQFVQESAHRGVWDFFAIDRLCLDPDDPFFWADDPGKSPPVVDFRFCNFYVARGPLSDRRYLIEAGDWYTWSPAVNLSLRDCKLYGGSIWLGQDWMWEPQPCAISWVNNLFNSTEVFLAPWWMEFYYGPPDWVELAFEARNNLFQRGDMMLGPIPSQSWVIKDNLFDEEWADQLTSETIDHDYNGYWPQTPRLTPSGTHDKLLTSAPAYQVGPLGNYYLPTSSSQSGYTLRNAGSRTVSAARLAQYTTRVDQAKENKDLNVTIGLHYVATAGSTSTMPKDTDSDGIPDYVEDANGNGLWDSDTETKVDDIHTDSGIADFNNSRYDDIDLDGDGMVGRVETALTKNSLVSDNPLSIASFPGSTVGGIVQVLVNVSSALAEQAEGVSLLSTYIDPSGEKSTWDLLPATGAEVADLSGSHPAIEWNTSYHPNGLHAVCLALSYGDAKPVYGPLRLVNTDNKVLFPDPFDGFGNGGLNVLAVAGPNAEYVIKLYDENAAPLTYNDNGVQREFTLQGTADSSGLIDLVWDLTFPNGSAFAGETIKGDFFVTARAPTTGFQPLSDTEACPVMGSGPHGCGSRCWKKEPPWEDGDFLVARTQECPDEDPRLNGMTGNIIDVIGNWIWYDAYYDLSPSESLFIPVEGWLPWPQTADNVFVLTAATRQHFLETLPSSRNLLWMGHSSGWGFGSSQDPDYYNRYGCPEVGGSRARISSGDVRDALSNNARRTFNHPYRLVMMAGCCGATGDLSEAFGIPHHFVSVAYYTRHGVPPRAFIGATYTTGDLDCDNSDNARKISYSHVVLFRHWMWGDPLSYCLQRAQEPWSASDPLDCGDDSPLGKVRDPLHKDFVILGAQNLTIQ